MIFYKGKCFLYKKVTPYKIINKIMLIHYSTVYQPKMSSFLH